MLIHKRAHFARLWRRVRSRRTTDAALRISFGVICDSLQVGLLISWNAHTRAPVEAFVAPGLAGVPPEVADRFTRCRPFTRHLGHWLVPLGIDTVPATQAEFAARYYVCVIPRSLSEPRMTHPERSAGGGWA